MCAHAHSCALCGCAGPVCILYQKPPTFPEKARTYIPLRKQLTDTTFWPASTQMSRCPLAPSPTQPLMACSLPMFSRPTSLHCRSSLEWNSMVFPNGDLYPHTTPQSLLLQLTQLHPQSLPNLTPQLLPQMSPPVSLPWPDSIVTLT